MKYFSEWMGYLQVTSEWPACLHIGLTVFGIALLTFGGSKISAWLRPKNPYKEKLTTYESGIFPIGNTWGAVNTRLYQLGLVFVLFELETVLFFPWATGWNLPQTMSAQEGEFWPFYLVIVGTVFILVLTIGLIYVVVKGRLLTNTSQAKDPILEIKSKVPLTHYERINAQYVQQQDGNQ